MRDKAIGVFDSGLGGLAVVSEILKEMPQEDIVYFADFARLPYGPRPRERVKEFTLQAVDFFVRKGVKTILIACNTASAAAAAVAQEKARDIPVIGMIEPAVEATLRCGNIRKVGVIGTVGTIKSGEYEKVFKQLSPSVEVFGRACPELLRLAEQGEIMDKRKIRLLAKDCVGPLEKEKINVLVLGCTDFTCIAEELRAVVAPEIRIVDPAREVVRKADATLRTKGWRRLGEGKGRLDFYATGEGPKRAKEFAKQVFNIVIGEITVVNVNSQSFT